MPDPQEGTLQESTYSLPANAVVEHPELLLVGVVAGIGLAFTGPSFCATEFYPTQCEGTLWSVGWGLATVTGLGYGAFKCWRFVRTGSGEQS